jgi:hypothetical protein
MISHKIGLRSWGLRLELFFFHPGSWCSDEGNRNELPTKSKGVPADHVLGSKRGNYNERYRSPPAGVQAPQERFGLDMEKSLGVLSLSSQAKRQSNFSEWSRWEVRGFSSFMAYGYVSCSTEFQHRFHFYFPLFLLLLFRHAHKNVMVTDAVAQ